jgi:hypothetical protein
MKAIVMAACLLGICARADAASITIAWDPNSEFEVLGYIVYVGTSSGKYTMTFDVGPETAFVFPSAVENQTYYFTVAAYTAQFTSPRSEELSGSTGSSVLSAADMRSSAVAQATTCAEGGQCTQIRTLAKRAAPATSLAPAPDGRLFLVEGNRTVLVAAGDAVLPTPALVADDPTVTFGAVAVDPAFTRTHFVFVGEIQSMADGRRQLTIARYREVANRLGERAAIVAGLPLPAAGSAPIGIDAAGRLYAAMPALAGRDPYSAMLLRFAPDGTTPKDNATFSPVYAAGLPVPLAMAVSPAGSIWLAGTDGSDRAAIATHQVAGDAEFSSSLAFATGGDAYRATLANGARSVVNRLTLAPVVSGAVASAAAAGDVSYVAAAVSENPADGYALLKIEPTPQNR